MTKQKKTTLSIVVCVAFLVLVYMLDEFLPSTSKWTMLVSVIEKGSVYALVAVSMNLLNGFTGLFSLGQAGFMLVGAYTYSIFTIPVAERAAVYQYFDGGIIQFSIPEIIGNALGSIMGEFGQTLGQYIGMFIPMIGAGILAALIAFLIGLPVLKLKSDYLAIATLGFAEILRAVFQWNALGPVTNGSNLLRKFSTYGSAIFPVIIAGLCIAVIVLIINSSYGIAFKAIRDDEIAAEAMGVNLFKHKQLSFVISSFFAGIGGALFAMFQNSVSAATFTSNMTYELLLIVVIGGIGSVTGSVLGAFLFVACSEWWLRFLDAGKFMGMTVGFMRPGFRKVVFAIIIMLIVLFYRRGIMGTNEFSWEGFIGFFKSLPSRIKAIPSRLKNSLKKRKTDTQEAKEVQ